MTWRSGLGVRAEKLVGCSRDAKARFATLTDCDAEPTGIYFDIRGWGLFVNAQHRGGDGLDKAVLILPPQ